MRERTMLSQATIADTTAKTPTEPDRERYARERFEANIARLRIEIRLGTARRNLDVAIELCEFLLEASGSGKLVEHYRAELDAIKAGLNWRHTARRGGRR